MAELAPALHAGPDVVNELILLGLISSQFREFQLLLGTALARTGHWYEIRALSAAFDDFVGDPVVIEGKMPGWGAVRGVDDGGC